jgi:hypothetical protein
MNKLWEVVDNMSRIKLFLTCLTFAILLATAVSACAAAIPATTPPSGVTPSGDKLSFTPAKYTNDEHGFYVLYPDTMKTRKPTSQWSVLDASDPATIPSIGVSVEDSGNVEQNTMTVYTALGGTKITKVSQEATTLADGKTKAIFTKRTWQIGSFPITTLTLTVERGAKTIDFSYSNTSPKMDEKTGKEVLYTLTFTNR